MNFINPFAFLANYFTRTGDNYNAKIGHVNAVIEELNASSGKVYLAYIDNDNGNNDEPIVTVVKNTLGFEVEWSKGVADGLYYTSNTEFDAEKTTFNLPTSGGSPGDTYTYWGGVEDGYFYVGGAISGTGNYDAYDGVGYTLVQIFVFE